jgi:hypothetical protein
MPGGMTLLYRRLQSRRRTQRHQRLSYSNHGYRELGQLGNALAESCDREAVANSVHTLKIAGLTYPASGDDHAIAGFMRLPSSMPVMAAQTAR